MLKEKLKAVGEKAQKIALVPAVALAVSAPAFADPVSFSVTEATAQIEAGTTTIVTVFGTLFAVASVILIGRWLLGLFRR